MENANPKIQPTYDDSELEFRFAQIGLETEVVDDHNELGTIKLERHEVKIEVAQKSFSEFDY